MIPKDNLIDHLRKKLPCLEVGEALEVLTYKRNRGILIEKKEKDAYLLEEHGYKKENYGILDQNTLLKKVASILKREFPRSQQVRLYHHKKERDVRIKDHPDIRI